MATKKLAVVKLELKDKHRNRRFTIVLGLLVFTVLMTAFGGYLVYTSHSKSEKWVQVITIITPFIITAIGGWLGIETSKMRGGRDD